MKRKSDNYMNATQLLKVAGFSKPKRTKILEREILQGGSSDASRGILPRSLTIGAFRTDPLHEKIQGGYGKYQGTW